MHGGVGGSPRRQKNGGHSGRKTDPSRRKPENRTFKRSASRLWTDGHKSASQQSEGLCRLGRERRRQTYGRWPRLQTAGIRKRKLYGGMPVRRGQAEHAHLQRGNLRTCPLGRSGEGL